MKGHGFAPAPCEQGVQAAPESPRRITAERVQAKAGRVAAMTLVVEPHRARPLIRHVPVTDASGPCACRVAP